jgi:cytochrome c biogenesis protein CcdA
VELVEVILEEYKMVRQESLESVGQQQTVAQYAVASISVGLGLGLVTANENATASAVILMGMLPVLIMCWAAMIVVAAQRVLLGRRHLRDLERRVAVEFTAAPPPLSWERCRSGRSGARFNGYAFGIVIAISTAAAIGPVLGGLVLWDHKLWVALVAAEALDIAGIVGFGVWITRAYRRLGRLR